MRKIAYPFKASVTTRWDRILSHLTLERARDRVAVADLSAGGVHDSGVTKTMKTQSTEEILKGLR